MAAGASIELKQQLRQVQLKKIKRMGGVIQYMFAGKIRPARAASLTDIIEIACTREMLKIKNRAMIQTFMMKNIKPDLGLRLRLRACRQRDLARFGGGGIEDYLRRIAIINNRYAGLISSAARRALVNAAGR